ncbi:OST-HTH/LOTUS domain-containing protein [Novosphingobium malaysiense]|uniref:OST-HTH/LOTUS domain-containing protein n=1 Tax=Novosphingobium malaysiense TaxID=1348853 RepID=UPI001E50F8C2|nr:OST-HTH/LOTUS domain-containing protein [Novosphingobium malaysiense]
MASAAKPKGTAKSNGNSSPLPPPKAAGKALSQDTKLVIILRRTVEATAREDGWSHMAAAGLAARRQAPIYPRNYGVKNFTALFEATGLFQVERIENGQSFVADKRNKERTTQPSR